jgi:hypothetical protein
MSTLSTKGTRPTRLFNGTRSEMGYGGFTLGNAV